MGPGPLGHGPRFWHWKTWYLEHLTLDLGHWTLYLGRWDLVPWTLAVRHAPFSRMDSVPDAKTLVFAIKNKIFRQGGDPPGPPPKRVNCFF